LFAHGAKMLPGCAVEEFDDASHGGCALLFDGHACSSARMMHSTSAAKAEAM
jgi:hypothetical protein